MKIAYTISGLYNSGGMERILTQKANYLAEELGYDVSVIVTDQDSRPMFFEVSDRIRVIDLGINYYKAKESALWHVKKAVLKRRHRAALSELLHREHFDIVISLMDFDFGFLSGIGDGSKKVLEYHFSKYSKVLGETNPLKRWLQKIRVEQWYRTAGRYDRFVVLTEEDRRQWGDIGNMEVIPNFITGLPDTVSGCTDRRVVSVGRADYQKGFDLLIDAWRMVHAEYPDWNLAIVGGE